MTTKDTVDISALTSIKTKQISVPTSALTPPVPSSQLSSPSYEQSTAKSSAIFFSFAENTAKYAILIAICVLAFATRIFSVLRFESIIHEFDPWFNFRSTQFLVEEGFYAFHNWYDPMAWYPYGRHVGGTVYPGLMWTASIFFHFLNHVVHYAINIRNTCVFLSPFMAAMTCIAVYLFTTEVWNSGAGIAAAALIALAGGYVQRSVAGSYDNEAVAIFALTFCFYLWVRAVNRGTIGAAVLAAFGYAYMVAAWGGYVFIINIIPIHVLFLIATGRFSRRIYVAYNIFYIIGSLLSMLIPFVNYQPMSFNPEHIGSFGVFLIIQIFLLIQYFQLVLSPPQLKTMFRSAVVLSVIGATFFVIAALMGKVPFFTARLLSLLGSSSAAAIVKSVSEHQPSTWTSFFFDLHMIVFLIPIGIYFTFTHLTDANLFAILYLIFGSYFASVMVRIVIVLTPGACCMAGIALNVILTTYSDVLTSPFASDLAAEQQIVLQTSDKNSKPFLVNGVVYQTPTIQEIDQDDASMPPQPSNLRRNNVNVVMALIVLAFVATLCGFYVKHMSHVTSIAYSSPTIILMSQGPHGRVIFDDYREAYSWIKHNTAENAKILSWWDYGYQLAGMAQRATIVDNNTNNSTQIATAGLILSAPEERSYEVMKMYDIDYLLVVFGGRIGYSSDDINKFLWIVRITAGIYPEIVEGNFYTPSGQYKIDNEATPTFRNSMMYKMCYYKAQEGGLHYDRARNQAPGNFDITFKYVEEAFTSSNWMVRVYRVKKTQNYPGLIEKLEIQQEIENVNP